MIVSAWVCPNAAVMVIGLRFAGTNKMIAAITNAQQRDKLFGFLLCRTLPQRGQCAFWFLSIDPGEQRRWQLVQLINPCFLAVDFELTIRTS